MQSLEFLLRQLLLDIEQKEEPCPLPILRLYLQFTPHLPKYLIANSEPQPNASWIDLLVIIPYLAKHAEELSLVLLLYAHPIIFNADLYTGNERELLLRTVGVVATRA